MKLSWLLLIFTLCAGQITAQTGATIELDGDGWTVFTLRPGGSIYYVSAMGSDSNDGLSPEKPFRSIQRAMTRMSGGDWVLLKRGDVFNQAIDGTLKSGPSAQYKTVFGAYGDPSDPRPIIDPPGAEAMFYHSGHTDGNPIKNLALVSLHMYQRDRDPSYAGYNPSAPAGIAIQFFPNGEELLFEDLRVEFFTCALALQGDVLRSEGGYRGINKVTLRRCAFVNNYSAVSGVHSSGIYWDGVFNYRIEENFFDQNGHYPGITTGSRAIPTIFNHNMYIQGTCGPDALVQHNIIARASSHGVQLRPGGTVQENVFIHNGIGGFVADNHITVPATDVMVMNNNVIMEAATWALSDGSGGLGVRAWGILLEDTGQPIPNVVEMKNNIVTNGGSQAQSAYQVTNRLQSTVDTSGNITYNWGTSPTTPGVFPDPSRTSGSYNASVGGENSMLAYLAAVHAQRKGNWNKNYTWGPIHNYINQGFGRGVEVDPNVYVTRVTVLPESTSIAEGLTEQLGATVLPLDAFDKSVVWSSDNPAVATVGESNGIVTAVTVGTATITATTVDGGYTDTCVVTVTPSPLKEIDIAYAENPPVIDGNTSEWADVPGSPVIRLLDGTIANANDLSGVFKATWDADYLYVNIRVLDNVIRTDASLQPYQRDGIELALNLRNSTAYNLFSSTADDGQGKFTWVYGDTAAMTRTEPRMLGIDGNQLSDDYQLVFTAITGGYEMESRIPWSDFDTTFVAQENVSFEAEIFFNDSDDGLVRKGVASWSGLQNINADNTEFGKIRLVETISLTPNFWSSVDASLQNAETATYFSSWFGYFNEEESWNGVWIQHEGLGWLNTGAVTEEGDIWLWSPHMWTWLYTSAEHFPWVWVREDAESLWTEENGAGWMYYAQLDGPELGSLYSHALEEWLPVILSVSPTGSVFEIPASATTVYRVAPANNYSGAATGAADGFVAAGKWNDNYLGNGFLTFELPVIAPGEHIVSITLTVQHSGENSGAAFNISLYGMGLHPTTGTAGNTYANYVGFTGVAAHPQAGELLVEAFINPSLANWSQVDVDIDVGYVTSLYDQHAGTFDYLVLRTTPAVEVSAIATNQRVHFAGNTNEDANFTIPATLTIVTAP